MRQGVLIPITLIPGNSVIHRIAPLPKWALVIGVLFISFSTRNILILSIMFILGAIYVTIAGLWKPFVNAFIIWIPLSVTLIFLQAVAPAFPRPWIPIMNLGPFTIYQIGIYSGISLLLRAWVATIFALVAIMTTHPSDLFSSMEKLGFPYVVNFILIMALELIPLLQNEFYVVLSAQKSRGLKGAGFSAILPSMVPVFAGSLERVQQLSISLESRAFGSKGKRTSYRQVSMFLKDYLFLIISILGSIATLVYIFINRVNLDWSRTLQFPVWFAVPLVIISLLGFLSYGLLAIYVILKA
jgi:energy-coupling factor transport system permease protein